MKRRLRFWFLIGLATVLVAALGVMSFLWTRTRNFDRLVDALAKVQLQDRWADPSMQKIRDMGAKAVPDLRRILCERDSSTVKLLQKAEMKWPKAVHRFVRVDDQYLRERQSVACQAIEVLQSIGRPAAPELIEILRSGDLTIMNGAISALRAAGTDADICERLGILVEQNALMIHQHRAAILMMGIMKPPSERTLNVIAKGFTNSSFSVQQASAEAAGNLGVVDPRFIAGLKSLQTNAVDNVAAIKASSALWKLTKERDLVLEPVFKVLERRLAQPLDSDPKPGDSGQVISHGDQLFMGAGEMFHAMKLEEPERAKARALLESWSEKAGRIWVEMRLLPAEFELGMPKEKCVQICRDGLARKDVSYRIEAARLLARISERFNLDLSMVNQLLRDPDVNVRIYAARIHWTQYHDAKLATVLADALDREKHQSYWFERNLPVALETLRDMGPAAKEAIPGLEKVTKDANSNIVALAKAALLAIRQ